MKRFSGALALTLACGSLATNASQAAGTGLAELETELDFLIQAPSYAEPGVFVITKPEAAAASAVTYHLANGGNPGEIRFNISDRVGDSLDNPLFCFDFASNTGAKLKLQVVSVGGQSAISGLAITSALQYGLSNKAITITPQPSAQCFYRGLSGDFGLFGKAPVVRENSSPEIGPEADGLFIDGFEAEMRLSVLIENVVLTSAGLLTYDLIVANHGQGDLTDVHFQEVYPSNAGLYPAALPTTIWACDACAANPQVPEDGNGPIRFENVSLAVGEQLVFAIQRFTEGSGTIKLYAAAVAAPGPSALFDVAEAEVIVP